MKTLTLVTTMIAAAVQVGVTLEKAELDAREDGAPPPTSTNNCHIKLWLRLLILGGFLWPISTRAASFNCSQARRPLEVLICNDAELSSLDGREGDVYYALRATVPKGSTEAAGLLSEQREFLRNRTTTCSIPGSSVPSKTDSSRTITCLKEFYTLRLNDLLKRLRASYHRTRMGIGQPDRVAADFPSDLLAVVRKDLDDDDEECLRHLKADIITTPIDVNQLQPAWLVEGINCLAGANNGPKLLYIRAGNGWRKIFDGIGQALEVGSTSTHGLPDLVLDAHASAAEEDETVYQFDGKEYKETSCNDVLAPGCSPCSPGPGCENGMRCREPMPGDKPTQGHARSLPNSDRSREQF